MPILQIPLRSGLSSLLVLQMIAIRHDPPVPLRDGKVVLALALHWLVPSERLASHQWLGILLAFTGAVAAFTGGSFSLVSNPRELSGDTLGVALVSIPRIARRAVKPEKA